MTTINSKAVDPGAEQMSEKLPTEAIKHMVERFLSWRIPTDRFHPDNGVSAKRPNYAPNVEWYLTGTNLFDYTLAEEMVRHMVEGLPQAARPTEDAVERVALLNDIAVMMSEFVDNWPNPKKVETALALIGKTVRAALDPPHHKEALSTMFGAFRTTVASDGRYTMQFAFRSMEEMHMADIEWLKFRAALTDTIATKDAAHD